MEIITIQHLPTNKVVDFFNKHWGSTEMVISSGIYDCSTLDGFAVLNGDRIIGLITYIINNDKCEIISLDSLEEGKGIGTALLREVEELAKNQKCKVIHLITTNDNLIALKFYQKRAFLLSEILNNAVEKARKLKPEIPLVSDEGIPIRDEIVLMKKLDIDIS
ncbi:GNAT family N-acetyltransferase [Oceanobacillus sp. 1P07AA]|uniref:GNAT family N-acetyltransferase n=1 Tax=Oceanobacillus sp. 1P07AA TaxID=3132293 RepID=UPI0039A4F2E8